MLAIRGTASVSDGLTDVLGASLEFGTGVFSTSGLDANSRGGSGNKEEQEVRCEAHAGFVHSAKGVLQSLGMDTLEEHVFSTQRPLIIIGHSLGGGTAAAVTVELLQLRPELFDVGFPGQTQKENHGRK